MIADAANWFFATVLINLLFDCVLQNGRYLIKFRGREYLSSRHGPTAALE